MQHAKPIPHANTGEQLPPTTPSMQVPVAMPLSRCIEMRVRSSHISLDGLNRGQIVWAIQMHMENWSYGLVTKDPGSKSPAKLSPERFLRRDMLEPVDPSDAKFLIEEEASLRTKWQTLKQQNQEVVPPASATAFSTA